MLSEESMPGRASGSLPLEELDVSSALLFEYAVALIVKDFQVGVARTGKTKTLRRARRWIVAFMWICRRGASETVEQRKSQIA